MPLQDAMPSAFMIPSRTSAFNTDCTPQERPALKRQRLSSPQASLPGSIACPCGMGFATGLDMALQASVLASQPAAAPVLPVDPGDLPTPHLDKLQRPLYCIPCCQRLDKLLRERLLQPNPLSGPLLQEGASCGPSCGPTSASKPGLQAHFMCEQLAHRVRQLSLEKQVCLCCLAAASSAVEVRLVS